MTHLPTFPLPPVTLVLGGLRSGKSAYGERMAALYEQAIYLATAQVRDEEMRQRILRHQARRSDMWITVEEPLDLPGTLRAQTREDRPVLVDCLTVWLSNVMEAGRNAGEESRNLLKSLVGLPGPVILVANEVGMGGVSPNALARAFADAAGELNQAVAMTADRVVLMTAGIPVFLKDVKQ